MGIDQLSQLLRESAAEVPVPDLAEAAWDRAVRVRRRRQLAGAVTVSVAVGVLALGVGIPLGGTVGDMGTAPVPTETKPVPGVTADEMPDTPRPRAVLGLPRSPDLRATAQQQLSQRPVERAVALYERASLPGAPDPEPVFVLGSDGALRVLDGVGLDFTVDEAPLQPTSLSPDGRRAAFPQVDELVVVDLTTGEPDTFRVPGFNVSVRWLSADTVLVEQSASASIVDVARRTVTAAPRPTDTLVPDPVFQWSGPRWRNGNLEVGIRVGGPSRGYSGTNVAVVDVRTGAVVRLLVLGPAAGRADATALGWLDSDAVLLRTDQDGVVAWNTSTGEVTSVTGPFDGQIAIVSR